MSIAAAYVVSDGVVLGADSSTTVQVTTPEKTGGVVQLLSHSQKVFEVGNNSRLGVCTWGAGNVGNISHRTIIARLSDKINNDTNVQDAATELVKIVEPEIKKSGIDFVGYYLGGWNPVSHEPACFHIEIWQDKNKNKTESLPIGLCSFSGHPKFFLRVFRGFDPQLLNGLKNELKKALPPEALKEFDNTFDTAFDKASQPLVTAGFQDLPIREAIDFIYSYLHITVKALKFKFGPPICGGPIEVGFISTDRNFRWVRHKPFYSAMIEQEGEYDVR